MAPTGGVDWWKLGSSTQRALTRKSLCVPSGEGDTHSVACSLSEQIAGCPVAFVPMSCW